MFRNPLLVIALAVTGAIAVWGLLDPQGMAAWAARGVTEQFTSRGWFIMLVASTLLIAAILLAISPFGRIRLGGDHERPEFGTVSWLTMLFAAGMGVGLLYYGAAEPITHFTLFRGFMADPEAASLALLATYVNWGLHAWAIYGMVGLVMAYFAFRRGGAMVLSTPITGVLGTEGWPKALGFAVDLLAIVAISIGLAGSLAMGVFQVQEGIARLLGLGDAGLLTLPIFALLCASFILPLTVDLSKGMALMSNTAMAIAGALLVFLILVGTTHVVMNALVEGFGSYVFQAIPLGFTAFTFFDETVRGWFQTWTLNYMIWWLAWAPFVGVFIARISRGRTIREFLLCVVGIPSAFSVVWFGTFGALGFSEVIAGDERLVVATQNAFDSVTFAILEQFPLTSLTSLAIVVAVFLFVVTSVVSAAYTLAMFATRGDVDPPVRTKIVWGVILAALGLVMILSGDVEAVRSIIGVFAIAFVFIAPLLLLCLGKALVREPRP
jgi:glycine betaine transporter